MKKFNPAARVALEDGPANDHAKMVMENIRSLDMKAKRIREQGGNPRMEMIEDVNAFVDHAAFALVDIEDYYKTIIDGKKAEVLEQRTRNSQKELYKLETARLEMDMMTDDELLAKAHEVSNGGTIDEYEGKLLAGRLAEIDPARAKEFKEAAKENHTFEPWLQDPEILTVAKCLETVKHTKPGNVAFIADEALMQTDIESLIDFDGELDKV